MKTSNIEVRAGLALCLAEAARRVAGVKAEYPGCEGAANCGPLGQYIDGGITASPPNAKGVGHDYLQLISAFAQGVPTQLATQEKYDPGFISTALSGVEQAAPDLLGLFSGASTDAASRAETGANAALRTGNVGDVGRLGAAASAAVRGVNPQETDLVDQLTRTASTQLAAGTQLLPGDVNKVTTAVRGDWANRGLADSGPAQLDEAMQLYGAGQNVLTARENNAASAANLNYNQLTIPALGLVSGTSTAPATAVGLTQGATQFAGNAGPSLIPSNQSYDMFNTAYNATAAANIATANNMTAADSY